MLPPSARILASENSDAELKSEMNKVNKKIKVKIQGEFIPQYQSDQAAGCDLYACVDAHIVIEPGAFCTIPTGIRLEIPQGYEAQVRPRSGFAMRNGIGVLNSPGTIDADYRGEIKVVLFNYSKKNFIVRRGDRIAQLVFSNATRADFIPTRQLRQTKRGSGGFGHTGSSRPS